MTKIKHFLKPEFEERMKKLLDGKEDFQKFTEIIKEEPQNAIRCNTLKISCEKLKSMLGKKGWEILQPYPTYPEIMIIDTDLKPGELGKCQEHLLGYYYVQEVSSQMPLLALKPKPNEILFDCCASPGSKTTQAAAMMENSGTIIANDNVPGRIKILAANTERCGASNVVITREDAIQLPSKIRKNDKELIFDKILADVPCSGEGTLRSSSMSSRAWNFKIIQKFSRKQKFIASNALSLLKPEGEMIYSTCTHGPEENEEVVQHLIENFDIEIMEIKSQLPIKTRPGLSQWNKTKFHKDMKKCARIYPHDNDTEGFFICKMKKIK